MSKIENRMLGVVYATLLAIMVSISQTAMADEYVIELYDTYCSACHSTEGTGAPLAFKPEQWQKYALGGEAQLVNNAITGVGNMPAQGGCMECAYEDFEDLIDYMRQPQGK